MSKLKASIISLFPEVPKQTDKTPKSGYPVGFLWVDMIGITDWVKSVRMVRRDSTIGLMELRVWELRMKVCVVVFEE